MKKILMALALLIFASCVDLKAARTPRLAAKKADKTPVAFGRARYEELTPMTTGSTKDRIATLKHNIKDAHERVETLHKQIHAWTTELAPLEVEAHHAKASKKVSHPHHHNVSAPTANV